MSLKIFKIIVLSFSLFILGACSSKRTHKIDISGVVYDSDTQTPISNTTVKIEVSNPRDIAEISTNSSGEFLYSSDGFSVLSEDMLSAEDYQASKRNLKVSFEHPDFVGDDFQEEIIGIVPVQPFKFDVGAFYLSHKDTEIGNVDIGNLGIMNTEVGQQVSQEVLQPE